MRASKTIALLIGLAAITACKKPVDDQNVAIDINSADPADIEALPPDESSATPSNELVNGDDNPDVNDLDNTTNSY